MHGNSLVSYECIICVIVVMIHDFSYDHIRALAFNLLCFAQWLFCCKLNESFIKFLYI